MGPRPMTLHLRPDDVVALIAAAGMTLSIGIALWPVTKPPRRK